MVNNLPANAGDMCSVLRSGGSPGGGNGNPLQHSCLENPKDRGASQATVRRVVKSQPRLKRLSTHAHNQDSCKIYRELSYAAGHCKSPTGRMPSKVEWPWEVFLCVEDFSEYVLGDTSLIVQL